MTLEPRVETAGPVIAARGRSVALLATPLAVLAVSLACTGAFFSIIVVQIASALGWAAWLLSLAGAEPGAAPEAARARVAVIAPLVAFFALSVVATLAGFAPREGLQTLKPELLAAGLLLAASRVPSPAAARWPLLAVVAMAAAAGIASVYQVTALFGGVVDVEHRTYGLRGAWDFVWQGHTSTVAALVGIALWTSLPGRVPWLALAGAALAGVGLVTSFTRASIITAAGLTAAVLVWRRAYVLLAVAGALVLGLLALPASRELAGRLRSSVDARPEGQNVYRVVRYQMGLEVIRDHPVLGVGVRGLRRVFPVYARPGAGENTHLHNTALQILAERGPLALLAWLLLLGGATVRALRRAAGSTGEARALSLAVGVGLLAVLAQSNFDYDWENWQMRALMLVFAGVAWSPGLGARAARDESE